MRGRLCTKLDGQRGKDLCANTRCRPVLGRLDQDVVHQLCGSLIVVQIALTHSVVGTTPHVVRPGMDANQKADGDIEPRAVPCL